MAGLLWRPETGREEYNRTGIVRVEREVYVPLEMNVIGPWTRLLDCSGLFLLGFTLDPYDQGVLNVVNVCNPDHETS